MIAPLIDTNGDGKIDEKDDPYIIFITPDDGTCGGGALGAIHAVNGKTGQELFTIHSNKNYTSGSFMAGAHLAVGDINIDGAPEILVTTYLSNLLAFKNDGSLLWDNTQQINNWRLAHSGASYQLNIGQTTPISIADIDADGLPDIIVGVAAFNGDGSVKWGYPSFYYYTGQGSPGEGTGLADAHSVTVADIDLDGKQEILAGNTVYNADGTVKWWNKGLTDGFSMAVNLNNDPYPEILFGTRTNNGSVPGVRIYLFDHTGNIIWGPVYVQNLEPTAPNWGLQDTFVIADFDGDGKTEIGIKGYNNFYVLDSNGVLKNSIPMPWYSSPYISLKNNSAPTVFDLNGDGRPEFISNTGITFTIQDAKSGTVLYQEPFGGSNTNVYSNVIVSDVDNDGHAELVVFGGDGGWSDYITPQEGLNVYGAQNNDWVGSRTIYNELFYHVTNVNDDGSIPQHEAPSWLLNNTYQTQAVVAPSTNPYLTPNLTASYLRVEQAGTSVNLAVRVGNGGAIASSPSITVTFYDGNPASNGTVIGTASTTRALNPGDYQDVIYSWTGGSLGLHHVYAVVDAANAISECRKDDNQATTDVTIAVNYPDLKIGPENIALPAGPYYAGTPIQVTATISNIGGLSASNVTVRLYNGNPASGGVQAGTDQVVPLISAGGTASVTFSYDTLGKAGTNVLYVVIDPANAIAEVSKANNSASMMLTIQQPVLPDLAVSAADIQLAPTAPQEGNTVTITATVNNLGTSVGTIPASFYIGNPASGGTLIASQTIYPAVALGATATLQASFNTAGWAGQQQVYVVVDPANSIAESNKGNNSASQSFFVQSAGLSSSMSLDKPAYLANDTVTSVITAVNTTSLARTLSLNLTVTDTSGNLIATISSADPVSIGPNSSTAITRTWNTGKTLAGPYTMTSALSESGSVVSRTSAGFSITADKTLSAKVTTDKISYNPNQNAALTAVLTSQSQNYIYGNLSLALTVTGATGTVVYSDTGSVSTLMPQATYTFTDNWNTATNPAGTYAVTLTVQDSSGASIGTSSASFTIIGASASGAGLTGTIAAALATVKQNADETITFTVTNNGNEGIASLTARVLIVNPDTQQVLQTYDNTAVLPLGQTMPGSNTAATGALAPRVYLAILQAMTPAMAQPKTLSSTMFTILDITPPVLTLSTLPDGSVTNNATLNIAGTATDNVAVQGVTINNRSVIINPDGTFSQAVTLVTGANIVTTMATDTAGNTTTDSRTIILDQTVPVITITDPSDNSVTSNPTVTFDGTTDKPCTVLISVNSSPTVTAATNATTFSMPVTLATNTNNTVLVYATDLAGNTSTAKRSVMHDGINPALAITSPNQDMGTNQTGITISGTVGDLTNVTMLVTCPTASIGVVSTPTSTTWRVDLKNMQQGTNSVTVQAMDQAGNKTSVIRNIISSQTPVTIDPVRTPTNIGQQQITGTMELNSTVTISCSTATMGTIIYPTTTTWQAIIANMTEGANIISATATDLEGNTSNPVTATIALDTYAPDTSITSGPALLTNINTASFSFLANEQGCTFECKLDNGTYSACTSPMNYISLIDGTHTFMPRATDPAGNPDPTPAVYIWRVDTIPPIAVIIGAPSSLTNARGASLAVTGDDVIAYKYHLDLGVFSAETSVSTPILLSGLLDGTHNVFVVGKDSAGNWQREENATIAAWTVDITPPALILSTLANGRYTNNPVLNIFGITSDANGIQSVVVSGQTVTTSTSDNVNYTFSHAVSLATGSNTITTFATDNAGNTTTDTRTIILDRTAPQITITSPADNSVAGNPSITVSGTTDKTATILISLNSGVTVTAVTNATTFSLPVTLATNTNNTVLVYATDLAGDTSTAKRSVMHDGINPALAITSPNQDMGTNQAGVLISGTMSDLTAVSLLVTCPTASIGVVSRPTSTTWSAVITNMQQGINAVTVQAMDQAGNKTIVIRNIISSQTPVTIDPVRTPTNISQQQITGTMELNSTVTVSSLATMGTISYPTTTTWQAIIANMAEGANIISATATDLEGYTSNPVTALIVLDTHAPITTPSPAPGGYYNTVTVTLATNEPATIYYTTDGATPTALSPVYSGPKLLTATTPLKFFAVDLAMNAEAVKSVTYTVIPDTTPPVTTIAAGAPNYTSSGGQLYVTSGSKFTLSALDNISGVATIGYRFDNGTWNTYASPFSLVTAGSHTIGYRSTDNAANAEIEKNLGLVIDNMPPVSTIIIGGPPVIVTTAITLAAIDGASGVKLTEYNIDGSLWTTYSGVFTLSGYSQGTHTINYRSTDNVMNVETPKSQTVQLWTDRPSITTTALAVGTVGIPYNQTLAATGGTTPYLWSTPTGTLPTGLLLNSTTGAISGTPTSAGTSTITYQAADTHGMTNTKVLAITIYSPPSITTSTLASGTTGSAYNQTLTATGGKTPYVWSISVGTLPTGLSLNGSTGVISGTSTTAGTSTFTAQVKDANNVTNTKALTITINSVLSIPQNFGVFGATGVTMSGGGYVDSYDSTQGAYSGIHGSNVSVGTNSAANGAITLSGGVVDYGNAYVGPGGDPAKVITASGGAVINGTKVALSKLKNMTAMSDPGGGTAASFINGITLTSGTYRVSSINLSGSGKGTINGNVTLYVTGSVNLSGSSQIVILPGGSLTIYLSGSLNVSGGSIVNQTLSPHNLTIYGTSTCTAASYSGTSALYGVIYSPAASTSISGGVSVYGSVIGRSVAMSGGAAVHYDYSLGNVGP